MISKLYFWLPKIVVCAGKFNIVISRFRQRKVSSVPFKNPAKIMSLVRVIVTCDLVLGAAAHAGPHST